MKKGQKTPQDAWDRLQTKLPELSDRQQQKATDDWLLKGASTSAKMAARATTKAIFDDDFYLKAAETSPQKNKKPLLRQLWAATTAVAAMFALGFYLYSMMSAAQIYPEIMARANAQPSEVVMLGGNYHVFADLSRLPKNASAGEFAYVAVPENAVRVSKVGREQEVSYYEVVQGEATYIVLTEGELPSVGEMVSFNAKLFWISSFGKATPILVEEVRHEVFE